MGAGEGPEGRDGKSLKSGLIGAGAVALAAASIWIWWKQSETDRALEQVIFDQLVGDVIGDSGPVKLARSDFHFEDVKISRAGGKAQFSGLLVVKRYPFPAARVAPVVILKPTGTCETKVERTGTIEPVSVFPWLPALRRGQWMTMYEVTDITNDVPDWNTEPLQVEINDLYDAWLARGRLGGSWEQVHTMVAASVLRRAGRFADAQTVFDTMVPAALPDDEYREILKVEKALLRARSTKKVWPKS